jgi:glycosyltransferase involved in cell wall biosynthesis
MGLAMRAAAQLAALESVADTVLVVLPLIDSGTTTSEFNKRFPTVSLELIPFHGREDTHFAMLSRLKDPVVRLAAFKAYGKPSLAAALSRPVLKDIGDIARRAQFDLIHVFRGYLAGVAEALPAGTPLSIDLDEDDQASWLSQASEHEERGNIPAGAWARAEAEASSRNLASWAARYAAGFAASPEDARQLRLRHVGLACSDIGNGIAIPQRLHRCPQPGTMIFVGSLGYRPNVDGLLWFTERVMPQIGPSRLLVAGSAPPQELLAKRLGGRIRYLGYVDRLADAYAQAMLAIAPMHAGGGTRIKILEAAAHAVPVVSTCAAASGIADVFPSRCGIAPTHQHFAAFCRELAFDRGASDRIGLRARRQAFRHHDQRLVARRWREAFGALLKMRTG